MIHVSRSALAALFAYCLVFAATARAAQDYCWVEGEQPASANVKWASSGSSHLDWLSGGRWLLLSIDEGKIETDLPAEGALLQYTLAANAEGKHELWIGFEFARSDFEWRLDSGDWKLVTRNELTTDCMELDFFAEAAWLKLADVAVAPGNHTLTIRLKRTKNAQGKFERVLFALDAICLSAKPFAPHSRYKPDEAYQTPQDHEAAKHVFVMQPLEESLIQDTAAPDSRRDVTHWTLPLAGLWEVCRHDEQLPGEVAAPIKDFPEHPYWGAIEVPSDRNTARPDLLFAHRLWYRTKVDVPQAAAGRSFFLDFPQNNLNTTVYVNGVLCGFDKNPLAHARIDVTKGVKAGQINEIWVGIRDAWYARTADPNDPMKLRRTFNLPEKFLREGFQELAYPVWNQPQSGILQTPTLVAAGGVYVADVFVKPSVANQQVAVEVTIANTTADTATGSILLTAAEGAPANGESRVGAPLDIPFPYSVSAGAQKTFEVVAPFPNAKLWWPDAPNLYTLGTRLTVGKRIADSEETQFGFREWSADGIHFKLNGVPFHGWCDQHAHGDDPNAWLAFQRKTHQQMMRFWGSTWCGLSPDQALDFFDKNGVVVRRSGYLDGEAIGYHADEPDPNIRKLYNNSPIKMDLMKDWRDQVCAQVKGERNHPSIMIWSIENEWLFINCINLYGGLMDDFEREVTLTSQAVQKLDPTRLTMSDGGAACKAQTLPVCGNHYITGGMSEYPALAYDANIKGGGRGRWDWDQKRPRFVGEDWFIAGNHPELATIGGEAALTGKGASLPAAGLMTRILQEGYRWADYGAWDFWMNHTDADGSQYIAFSPRAVLCRQWNFTFGSGERASRSLAIFNDTHDASPTTFTWTLNVAGKKVAGESREYTVAPGDRQTLDVVLALSEVEQRAEGEWVLSLAVKGQEIFTDRKAVSILPRAGAAVHTAAIGAGTLLLHDPSGGAKAFLQARGIAFTPLDDLNKLPETGKVLLIGKDAIDKSLRTSPRFAAWAAAGRTVIVLEQKEPLEYQSIPADIDPANNVGRAAFIEDTDHPIFRGLQSRDFFTWGNDEIVYRNAYGKPARGAKSLLECDNLLRNSAMVEVPVAKGVLILSQLALEEKLGTNATAQALLLNLVNYGAEYKQTFRPAVVTAAADSPLAKVVDAIGLTHSKAADALQAIAPPGERIALVEATPANLARLAANVDKIKAFNEAGGWILFHNLTPEGLADYNKIVGFEHMIRPFKRERVTFPATRSPLTAGITAGDLTMYTSKRIFSWAEGNYTVSDEFSYIVDYDEVAPFGKSPFHAYSNIVSGFTNADGWVFIINYEIPKDGSPSDIPISFPKPETFTEFTWTGNTNYWPQTKVNLIFDGDRKTMASFDTAPNGEPQTFAINPPRTARDVILEIAGWQEKAGSKPLIGIDNIRLKVKRPEGFERQVRQMLNIGGMMEYPRGKGGIVLCNLLFLDNEEVPLNAAKKKSILASILRNLKAPFSGGKTVIVGTNLAYSPIDISKQANQYRTDRGWFGDRKFTFADLPTGSQTLAGVPFDIFEFATSPVPTAIMLDGPSIPNQLAKEVKGIPVRRKADALFFLQAARIDRRRTEQNVKDGEKWLLARYVAHYADGQSVEIPIYSEIDVEDYRQEEPRPLPGAQIAWTHKYEGSNASAVAYLKQWNNPRPDAEIESIDLVYGSERVGVPALLAITAASTK